ncbi:MAG: hypothetical protein ACW96U_00700 [Candidatus Heimdallarchaeaceae archaeon]
MVEIWARYNKGEWELIDSCERVDLQYMLGEYRLAYGTGWEFRTK